MPAGAREGEVALCGDGGGDGCLGGGEAGEGGGEGGEGRAVGGEGVDG